jgi:YgiT-type zinc finger domain-containing protein
MNDDTDSLPENTCPACFEGTLREGFQDYTEDLGDGRQLLVKHLPARICNACGEALVCPAWAWEGRGLRKNQKNPI